MEMRRSSGGGGGGCCTTRYTTTPYIPYYTNDVSKMDRIMLRFRPIAPKPATSGSTSTSSTDSTSPKKRKSPNKTNKGSNNFTTTTTTRTKKSRSPSNANVVTLSLLPETPDLTRNNNSNDSGKRKGKEPTWLNFGPSDKDLTALEVIPSTVTVEQVSATWIDGCITDEERKRRLDEDTCPGFISDGWNRVWWTNEEYRKMVTGDKMDTWRKERLVSVKMEKVEKVENMYGGFTCRVRVQYGSHYSMTVPCDVWRMNSGGFAWRLDVKAALTLAL